MEFEFDKEIDSLLRQTARTGESVETFAAHLDADEISAFAENALTVKARVRASEHLADCARCRKILSNVISFNSEFESETIRAPEGKTVAALPPIPWYKRLFAFPQMTYAAGALALIFTGIIGFVALQSRNESQNASVARVEEASERPLNGKGASSDGATVSGETFSSNASLSNTATISNSTAMSNSNAATATSRNGAPAPLANSNVSVVRQESEADRDAKAGASAPKPEATPSLLKQKDAAVTDEAPPISENKVQIDGDVAREAEKQKNEAAQQNSYAQSPQNIMPDSRNVQRNVPQAAPASRARGETQSSDASAMSKKKTDARQDQAKETRSVGGKTFRREEGIWYDPAYKGEATTNVRRNTDAYERLDSGLRAIAQRLGGVVVVVWNGRAYRIQ